MIRKIRIGGPQPHPRASPRLSRVAAYSWSWHSWYWALLPLLAVCAYITVLRIGFLADDFFQLNDGRTLGINPPALIANYQGGFLRPVGVVLIYQLGWSLWGYNPLPYHIVGLVAHAASSLILGLWLATVTRKPGLGWLAGAFFAVFPLHVEAVGWVAAQFDTFAVLFTVSSLWLFTLWWRDRAWALYLGAWLLYGLAVFTKESVFTFVPIFAVSACMTAAPARRRAWGRLLTSCALLLLPIGLSLGIRYVKIGALGGYSVVRTDYAAFAWDYLATYLRMLLAPLNEAIFGHATVQLVWIAVAAMLLAALVLYGRGALPLLGLAGSWMVLTLLPVLNLARASDDYQRGLLPSVLLNIPPGADNLQQNRYLYLVSAGYLIGLAGLAYQAIASARRYRFIAVGGVAALLLLSVAVCWVQLRPWHTATVQVNDLEQQLIRLIPPRPGDHVMTWYSADIPFKYEGVPLLASGLGVSRLLLGGDFTHIVRVPDARQAPLAGDPGDAFALQFAYDPASTRFVVDYLSGITADDAPPTTTGALPSRVWDFRQCSADLLAQWRVSGASSRCRPGSGLLLTPRGEDPQMVADGVSLASEPGAIPFLRLRASVRYGPTAGAGEPINEWFTSAPGVAFGNGSHGSAPVKMDGRSHVYWTFLPVPKGGQAPTGLRFDPINTTDPVQASWIAVDLVR